MKIRETEAISIPIKRMTAYCHFYENKSGGVKLVLWASPSSLIDTMQSGKCFQQTVNTIDLEHQKGYLLVLKKE